MVHVGQQCDEDHSLEGPGWRRAEDETHEGRTRECAVALFTAVQTDAPITDVFPEVEIVLPRINRPDKTDLPAQEGNPLVRDRIVETFMRGTIPEFHGHLFLRKLGILSCNDVLSSLCIGGKPAGLEGNNR